MQLYRRLKAIEFFGHVPLRFENNGNAYEWRFIPIHARISHEGVEIGIPEEFRDGLSVKGYHRYIDYIANAMEGVIVRGRFGPVVERLPVLSDSRLRYQVKDLIPKEIITFRLYKIVYGLYEASFYGKNPPKELGRLTISLRNFLKYYGILANIGIINPEDLIHELISHGAAVLDYQYYVNGGRVQVPIVRRLDESTAFVIIEPLVEEILEKYKNVVMLASITWSSYVADSSLASTESTSFLETHERSIRAQQDYRDKGREFLEELREEYTAFLKPVKTSKNYDFLITLEPKHLFVKHKTLAEMSESEIKNVWKSGEDVMIYRCPHCLAPLTKRKFAEGVLPKELASVVAGTRYDDEDVLVCEYCGKAITMHMYTHEKFISALLKERFDKEEFSYEDVLQGRVKLLAPKVVFTFGRGNDKNILFKQALEKLGAKIRGKEYTQKVSGEDSRFEIDLTATYGDRLLIIEIKDKNRLSPYEFLKYITRFFQLIKSGTENFLKHFDAKRVAFVFVDVYTRFPLDGSKSNSYIKDLDEALNNARVLTELMSEHLGVLVKPFYLWARDAMEVLMREPIDELSGDLFIDALAYKLIEELEKS